MAGHSKWANIKHRKGAQDAKRGKLFTKLIRELTVSAKLGGDPNANPRLRAAMDKALSNNMTKDTIERAIKRGSGGQDGADLEEIRYEGYGPNGVAIMVDCLTDNRNRTVSEVRHAFSKMGGNLGTSGSVAYLFSQIGQIIFEEKVDVDKLMDVAIENGADDVIVEKDYIEVNTSFESFGPVLDAIKAAGFAPSRAEVTMNPSTMVELEDLDTAQKLMNLVERIEDLDDVQEVYTNADISDEVVEKL